MQMYYRPLPLGIAVLLVRLPRAPETPNADAVLIDRYSPPDTWLRRMILD